MTTQKARFLLRSGTAAQWASVNPILAAGEPGYETDTYVFKMGDGVTAWASLPAYERNRQAANANLAAEAGLTGAADRVSYYTGLGAKALATFNSLGRSLVGAANTAAARTALELGGLATVNILDEDSFATNSATRPPSQKSAKTYIADIINGVTGKPKVQGRALENVVKGEVTVNSGTYVGRSDLDGARHVLVNIALVGGSPGATITVRFTADNGATWSAPQNVLTGAPASAVGWFRIAFSNGGYGIRLSNGDNAAGLLTVPAGCNGMQFAHSAATTGYYDFFILGGVA